MPPGDTAYNVSKAGVKVLTEALQHKLRSTAGCQVNAFLLVPGCVNTMIRTRGDKWVEGSDFKPDRAKDEREYNGVKDRAYAAQKWAERGAWQPEQVIDELVGAISAGTPFYVICQDGETTRAMDDGRIQWTADDLVFRRAPLSRWSDDFKDEFTAVAKRFK
jgi:NAD(P)-dependent dehydrogenase (short-subunit alcohol dehydrogenase family)